MSENYRQQTEEFANRLRKRARHLRRWPKRGVGCFRLYEKDIPEIPLVIDRYEECLHMTEYERPHQRTETEHEAWLDCMQRVASEVLEVPHQHVFFKRRSRQRGSSQHERLGSEARMFVVSEGGLKFVVNLSDYVDTGLFLDHRITRGMVRKEAEGKRFLNLFCYTGSFSAYAAAGGAASTLSVDLSGNYLDWAAENMRQNGFEGEKHLRIRSDVMEFLRADTNQYDLAVVDPPTFSNSKSVDRDWDVQRDQGELFRLLLPRMNRGGVIYFSNNFRRFKLDPAPLVDCKVVEISRQTVPEDFRNKRIHRCWRIEC